VKAGRDIPMQAVEGLHAGLAERLVAVVLFGSRARGDDKEGSDWDLLVIVEGLPERAMERRWFLKRLLPEESRGAISILARTPAEFERRLASVYLDIALDGRILYDPQGYASEWLDRVKRLIERAGLYRERTPWGDRWLWEEQPSHPWVLEWEK